MAIVPFNALTLLFVQPEETYTNYSRRLILFCAFLGLYPTWSQTAKGQSDIN